MHNYSEVPFARVFNDEDSDSIFICSHIQSGTNESVNLDKVDFASVSVSSYKIE